MNKLTEVFHSSLIALSMLASSMPAFAAEIPEVVSGTALERVSEIRPDRLPPKLFGLVEHKIMLPQATADQLIKQTPTLAPVPPTPPLIGGVDHLEQLREEV